MDNRKLSGWMLMAAGGLFLFSGFVGGNFLMLPLGAVLILAGWRKTGQDQNQET